MVADMVAARTADREAVIAGGITVVVVPAGGPVGVRAAGPVANPVAIAPAAKYALKKTLNLWFARLDNPSVGQFAWQLPMR